MPDASGKAGADDGPAVRYYPRRVESPAAPNALTPSQALHLASDPARADRARRTGDVRHLQVPRERPGLLRRLLNRLARR